MKLRERTELEGASGRVGEGEKKTRCTGAQKAKF